MTEVDWPDVKVTGGGRPVSASSYIAVVGHGMIPKGTETYLALSKVRERLLSTEVAEAIAAEIARFRTFKPADEWLREDEEEAISKALAAAFPVEPGED